jgi:cell division GTPase FtsZ
MLNDGTRMAFITAGMGGGTGTGAAPVIAKVSKEMGILTVGIVTIPFRFEGDRKIDQALDGVEKMAEHVDALLVINNERLREIYPELTVLDAFGKADDTLSVAAKSIAEIITVHGLINLDFNDVKTVLKDGGDTSSGKERITIEPTAGTIEIDLADGKVTEVLLTLKGAGEKENTNVDYEGQSETHTTDWEGGFSIRMEQ